MEAVGFSSLGRFPLSVVLSFLTETDGTSVLITNRHNARQFLPLFRLPLRMQVLGKRKRHRYRVVPVQDPEILLQRLNTRRLRQRCRQQHQTNGQKQSGSPYEYNKTTEELAKLEWNYPTYNVPVNMELLRFLDNSEEDWGGVTLLASYPRSGNTLLRTLLERVTGVVTGADTRPDRPMSKSLALDYNLVGEGVTQGVRVVKTHYPERQGYAVHVGHKAVLLVRNPYDAIDSYWNFALTNTHTETVTDEVYSRFAEKHAGLAVSELGTWLRFHYYWLQNVDIPVLVVRFEDLILNTQHEMGRIMSFVTNESILTTFWKSRIQHACSRGQNNGMSTTTATLGSYRPRSATGGKQSIGKSLHRYSSDLLQRFRQVEEQYESIEGTTMLKYFGYDLQRGFPDNFVEHNVPAIPQHALSEYETTMTVNVGPMIRPDNDPYGRAMRQWRHSHTNQDANPFPTVARK